jgi:hypothetical protein
VLAILSISIDEINNTQENDSKGKGIGDKSIEIGGFFHTNFIIRK